MTIALPPGPGTAGVALRVWPGCREPEPLPPIAIAPRTFRELDLAFQHATGWKLVWENRPPCGNATRRKAPHHWLRIDDLSTLLPTGYPATSRIYCENLVLRLNRLFDELLAGVSTDVGRSSIQQTPPACSSQPRAGNQLLLDRICVVPLPGPASENPLAEATHGWQWYCGDDGSVFVGLFALNGPGIDAATAATALTVARSTFLVAARLNLDCHDIRAQVTGAIDQLFTGDVAVRVLVCHVDTLAGSAWASGDSGFDLQAGRDQLAVSADSAGEFVLYRNQPLLASLWSQPEPETMVRWRSESLAALRQHPLQLWSEHWPAHLARLIPKLESSPDLAVVISRL